MRNTLKLFLHAERSWDEADDRTSQSEENKWLKTIINSRTDKDLNNTKFLEYTFPQNRYK